MAQEAKRKFVLVYDFQSDDEERTGKINILYNYSNYFIIWQLFIIELIESEVDSVVIPAPDENSKRCKNIFLTFILNNNFIILIDSFVHL